jgi:PucR family transcriptional regulator, purine catabolism regulatory protein
LAHASVPASLVAACERAGLPLLVVPAPTPFLTISRRYWSMVAESGQRELAEMLSTHRALVAAAVGGSRVPSVLRRLAIAIDGWAAHLSVDGRLQAVWPPSQRSAARELQSAVHPGRTMGRPPAGRPLLTWAQLVPVTGG